MIALVQRVASASVAVGGETVGAIGPGLLVLVGVVHGDTPAEGAWLADRIARLRVFADAEGRMNRSLLDTAGGALVVSQFTLAGTLRKGTRPSFTRAAPPDLARPLYEGVARALAAHLGRDVPTGVFGADMQVHSVGDGPVTLWLDRPPAGAD